VRKNYLKGQLNFIILTLLVWFAAIYIAKDNILQLSRGIETQYSNEGAYEPGEAGYAVVKIINIENIIVMTSEIIIDFFNSILLLIYSISYSFYCCYYITS